MTPELEPFGQINLLRTQKEGAQKTIILFHGYGANSYDLWPLNSLIPGHERFNWIFPEAPLGWMENRAWYPIDVEQFQRACEEGTQSEYAKVNPPGKDEAIAMVLEMLKACEIDVADTILGGFSQGSTIALDVALSSKTKPAGLLFFSGMMVDEKRVRELASHCKGIPFFQSHGLYDPLISFSEAQRLESMLVDAGLVGELHPFDGGHEIPYQTLTACGTFLSSL